MTDWEDASRDELLARLDAALELLRIDADAEAGVYFDRMMDEAPAFSWPPAPNTAHPSLDRYAESLRHLMADGRHSVLLPRPPKRRWIYEETTEPLEPMPSPIHFAIRRAAGWAPYVGDPFVYEWKVAVDDTNHWVAADSTVVYMPRAPWKTP